MSQHTAPLSTKGLLMGTGAYLFWGLLPLYLHRFAGRVTPLVILSHRVVWSVVLLAMLLTVLGQWGQVWEAVRNRRTLMMLIASMAMVSLNWFTFVYVTTHGQLMQGALGYFLNPLMAALLGMVVFKERMRPLQWAAIAIAAAGVVYLSVGLGVVPQAALVIAASFAFYGVLRKIAPVDAVAGLMIETTMLMPVAVGYLAYMQVTATPGHDPAGGLLVYLMVGAGVLTATPLLLYSRAAKLLPFSTLGFMQYIGPTCQFACAVFAFGEPFTRTHAVAFGLIWTAVALFLADVLTRSRRVAVVPAQEPMIEEPV
jgi:chloramphenicol-sensitive protein RarD